MPKGCCYYIVSRNEHHVYAGIYFGMESALRANAKLLPKDYFDSIKLEACEACGMEPHSCINHKLKGKGNAKREKGEST
jgi:hypothetical protein